LIDRWLQARQPVTKPAGARSLTELNEEVLATLEQAVEPSVVSLCFQRQCGQIVMGARTVRAHIKDCARVLSAQLYPRLDNQRAFSTRVINGVYVDKTTYWLQVRRENSAPVTMADGVVEKPIHVRGPRGEPFDVLKRFEYIEPPSMLEFTLVVLGKSVLESDLHNLFTYGGTHGYAGERGDGEGRYEYTIERLSAAS
jgi:hypothetical protein